MVWLVLIFLILVCGVFGIVAMALQYMQKMERIKRGGDASPEVFHAIAALRKELADLRETTTSYDLSFDAALQRLEGRVGHLEERTVEAGRTPEKERVDATRINVSTIQG